jgi:hypothetical protein
MYVNSGIVIVQNGSSIEDSYANAEGGVMHVSGGSVRAADSFILRSMTRLFDGGVILVRGGDVELVNASIDGSLSGMRGGVLYLQQGHATIINTSIAYSNAVENGGAVHVTGGSVEVSSDQRLLDHPLAFRWHGRPAVFGGRQGYFS